MSFFRALFDFSFSEFVTPKIIKILYVISLVLIALAALAIPIVGATQGVEYFFIGLVGAVIFFGLYVIFARVGYEILIVVFQIAENTRDMAWSLTGGRRAPPAAPLQQPQYQQPQYQPPQYPPQQAQYPPQQPQYPQQPPQYPQYPQQPPQYPPKP